MGLSCRPQLQRGEKAGDHSKRVCPASSPSRFLLPPMKKDIHPVPTPLPRLRVEEIPPPSFCSLTSMKKRPPPPPSCLSPHLNEEGIPPAGEVLMGVLHPRGGHLEPVHQQIILCTGGGGGEGSATAAYPLPKGVRGRGKGGDGKGYRSRTECAHLPPYFRTCFHSTPSPYLHSLGSARAQHWAS